MRLQQKLLRYVRDVFRHRCSNAKLISQRRALTVGCSHLGCAAQMKHTADLVREVGGFPLMTILQNKHLQMIAEHLGLAKATRTRALLGMISMRARKVGPALVSDSAKRPLIMCVVERSDFLTCLLMTN